MFCSSDQCSRGSSQCRDGAAPLFCSPTLRFTFSGIQPELGRTCQPVYHSPAGAISWNIPEVLSEVTDHSLICGSSAPTPPPLPPPHLLLPLCHCRHLLLLCFPFSLLSLCHPVITSSSPIFPTLSSRCSQESEGLINS